MTQQTYAFEHGPYLQMSVFCEKVLQERDGVISVVRVIDRVNRTAAGPDAPDAMPSFDYQLTAVITLKAGRARGGVQVEIEPELPSGLRQPRAAMTAQMEGNERGQNLIMNLQMKFEEPGVYWFNVYVDGRLITRMPFTVTYSRISGAGPPRPG